MADEPRENALRVPREQEGSSAAPPFVVGIGASAGGLDALRALFARLPAEPGVAFVVVVHLSPHHESHFGELLRSCTAMPVDQVTSTVALEPNRVYVIPPNANLSAIDTHLRLSKLEERRAERAPIDHFLRTLATWHRGRAIGVILTGDGSDGALGLRRIRELGGLAVAQEPNEAENPSMPRSAIATGLVDKVLPLHEIGPEILEFCASQPKPGPDGALDESQQAALDRLLDLLRSRTGQDFSVFRPAVVLSRICRRMRLNHVDTLAAYVELAPDLPGELRALCDDLLVTVTEFFSDAKLFERLENDLIPRIFDSKSTTDRVRVWSIGCSTGEEAFSIAMLLLEQAARRGAKPKLQVFATDLSEDTLRRARLGVYPGEIAAELSPQRLARFFVREGDHYRVSQELRDVVVFAAQNLFRDPPYSRIDLVLCRNFLSDLQPNVSRGVLSLLYYALEPHGLLVASSGDVVDEPRQFAAEYPELGLYRKVPGMRRDSGISPSFGAFARVTETVRAGAARRGDDQKLAALHERVIERYMPPSVVVNAANDVVHYSQRAGAYVRFPGGEPTHNVLRLVREPLRSPLRRALVQVRRDGKSWHSPPLELRTEQGTRRVVLHVEPGSADGLGLLVVVFDERLDHQPDRVAPAREITAIDAIARLEDELESANARIRALLAGTDDGQLDSPLSNETLQRANDELRFILEELEGSREELQAANEELITLDAENRRKIEELAELSADLRHLLESTGVATLLLDRELRIVRFTPQLSDLFNVTLLDRGRPLSDLTHALRYADLETDLRRVLEALLPVDHEAEGNNGRWYLTRMLPYRTVAGEVDGVVLTLIDITDRKRVEEMLRDADRRKDEFLALLAHELRNPLAPITTGIEILSRVGNDPRTVAQITATMARQSKTLVRLVDDLLDVSRITGGRLRLAKAPTRIADVVRDAVAAVRPVVDRLEHELIVSVPDEPIVVDADTTRLAQVLGNLLNNAARYTPRHGQIELRVVRDGGDVVIAVADNGVGMSEDIRGRVFEMFFQGNDPRLVRNAGLGIGLTLARSLVEMHGGSISVESAGLDRGSVFTVRLPVLPASELPAGGDAAEPEGAGGHRVLIVDDNADAAETLRMLVKTFGDNDVRTAFSGPDALAASVDMHPNIVLLDLKMPGMDGFEVARRLRAQPGGSDMTIVAVTGWGQEEHKRRTREAGFDRHLTKPADRAELEAVLAGASKLRQPPATYAS